MENHQPASENSLRILLAESASPTCSAGRLWTSALKVTSGIDDGFGCTTRPSLFVRYYDLSIKSRASTESDRRCCCRDGSSNFP